MPRRQQKHRSAFLRGRRIAWLLASALPLLATEHDDHHHEQQQHQEPLPTSGRGGGAATHRPLHEQQPLPHAKEEDSPLLPAATSSFGAGRNGAGGGNPGSGTPDDGTTQNDENCESRPGASSTSIEFDLFPFSVPPLTTWWNPFHQRDTEEVQSPARHGEDRHQRPLPGGRFAATGGGGNGSGSGTRKMGHPPFLPFWEAQCLSPYDLDWCQVLPESEQPPGRHDNASTLHSDPQTRTLQQHSRKIDEEEESSPLDPSLHDDAPHRGDEVEGAVNETAKADTNRTIDEKEWADSGGRTTTQSSAPLPEAEEEERFVAAVDYASKSAGGLVLDKSPHFQGVSNLLSGDRDRYAIVECAEPAKWVVIGLSEDILVKRVVLAHYERYSSHVKDFALYASTTATGATAHWRDLGNFSAALGHREQAFDVPTPAWARYVKFQILSHHGNEHYCTVSQIKVHGSTVLQGFHEQWEEESEHEQAGTASDAVAPAAVGAPAIMEGSGSIAVGVVGPSGVSPAAMGTASVDDAAVVPNANFTTTDEAVWSNAPDGHGLEAPTKTNATTSTVVESSVAHDGESGVRWGSVVPESRPYASLTRGARVSLLHTWYSHRRTAPSDKTDANGTLIGEPVVSTNRSSSSLSLSQSLPLVQQTRTWLEERGWNASLVDVVQLSGSTGSATSAWERHRNTTSVPATEEDSTADNDTKNAGIEATRPEAIAGVETKTLVTEDAALMEHLLLRIPSASCLSKLDASARRVNQARKGGSGGAGSGSGAHTAAGGVEPIFKKLTDEIKALQATVGVYDEVARESVACYRRVLAGLFAAMEADRIEQDARLRRLEQSFFGGAWTNTFRSLMMFFLSAMLQVLNFAVEQSQSGNFSTPALAGFVAGLVAFFATGFVRLKFLKRLRSPTKVRLAVPGIHWLRKEKVESPPGCSTSSVKSSPLTPELFRPIEAGELE